MGEQKPEKTKKHICAGLLAHVHAAMAEAAAPIYELVRKQAGEDLVNLVLE